MPPTMSPAPEPGVAIAAAIAGILRALLAALFGDIAAMPQGGLRWRLHARLMAEIAALELALGQSFALPGVSPPAPATPAAPRHYRASAPIRRAVVTLARPRRAAVAAPSGAARIRRRGMIAVSAPPRLDARRPPASRRLHPLASAKKSVWSL